MDQIGKVLIFVGAVFLSAGFLFLLAGKVPWLGKLPGDIVIRGKNFSFYFPLATCILLSVILSLVFFFINRR